MKKPSKTNFFNPAVFSIPVPYSIGNAPRVLADVRAPSSNDLDASLVKNNHFGASDRYNVQWRFEMFNALNHQILGAPDGNIKDGTFGQIGNGNYANSARQIQVAGKFTF